MVDLISIASWTVVSLIAGLFSLFQVGWILQGIDKGFTSLLKLAIVILHMHNAVILPYMIVFKLEFTWLQCSLDIVLAFFTMADTYNYYTAQQRVAHAAKEIQQTAKYFYKQHAFGVFADLIIALPFNLVDCIHCSTDFPMDAWIAPLGTSLRPVITGVLSLFPTANGFLPSLAQLVATCGLPPTILTLASLKFWKLVCLLRLPNHIFALERLLVDDMQPRVLFLLFILGTLTHYTSLAWLYSSKCDGFGSIEFSPPDDLFQQEVWLQYLTGLHWALHNSQDADPQFPMEKVFHIIIMLLNNLVVVGVTGQVASFISNWDAASSEYHRKMAITDQYLSQVGVPASLKQRVREYHQYNFHRNRGVQEDEVLEDLNDRTRNDVLLYLTSNVMKNVPLFKDCPPSFFKEIVAVLRSQLYCPNEYVVVKGETGKEMFIVSSGLLAVLNDQPHIGLGDRLASTCNDEHIFTYLRSGDYFGEIALLRSKKRTASVRAIAYSDVYILPYERFQSVMEEYPDLFKPMMAQLDDKVKDNTRQSQRYNNKLRRASASSVAKSQSWSWLFKKIRRRSRPTMHVQDAVILIQQVWRSYRTWKWHVQSTKANLLDSVCELHDPSFHEERPFAAAMLHQSNSNKSDEEHPTSSFNHEDHSVSRGLRTLTQIVTAQSERIDLLTQELNQLHTKMASP